MPARQRDIFPGWIVFPRFREGYVAVREANVRRYVQAPTLIELEAAVVLANAADAWRESWGGVG